MADSVLQEDISEDIRKNAASKVKLNGEKDD